jgi:hypothetical protein
VQELEGNRRAPGVHWEETLATVRVETEEIREDVLVLQAQVTFLESALEAERVEVGGQDFHSELTVGEYITQQRANRGPLVFMIAVSLLQLAHRQIIDNSQAVKEQADAKKAGLFTDMDAYIFISYAIVLPMVCWPKLQMLGCCCWEG